MRVAPALHLTRLTTAFAAVANVWFVILWTRGMGAGGGENVPEAIARTALPVLLAAGAANALGLFAFAAALNDLVDLHRDQTLNPERPLASGRISVEHAFIVMVGALILAVLGAAGLGMPAVLLTLLVAGAVLLFNVVWKFVPGAGLVALGLIYAGQMVTPNLQLRFVWPVWLVMTHALLVAGVAHVVGGRRPVLTRRAIVAAVMGWAFWSCVMLVFAWLRNTGERERWGWGEFWPEEVPLTSGVLPLVLAIAFVVIAYRRVKHLGMTPRAADKIARYGALWLALYATAWLLGSELYIAAGVLGVVSLLGFLGMTVLRELFSLLEQPVAYRR